MEFKLTVENCLADFAIKPKYISEDIWLPIQLKTTSSNTHNIYKFKSNNQYKDIIVVLFYIDKNDMHKIWVLNFIENIPNNITIATKKSIYDIYEIGTAELSSHLLKLFNNNKYTKFSFNDINIPISSQCKQEQEFIKFREELLPNLNFQYPECNARVYDLIINNCFKVQDKVICSHIKKRKNITNKYYITALYRQNNILYKLGDNDYYWLFR